VILDVVAIQRCFCGGMASASVHERERHPFYNQFGITIWKSGEKIGAYTIDEEIQEAPAARSPYDIGVVDG
jgi:hypothetical protein